ncbi:DUF1176 domain-containing protein [Aeromonas veronii]|uniref:DUF1176 domain-containing protein n=1 Tax=Aeromonas veronii TaxID=654 RepID=UPI003D23DD88
MLISTLLATILATQPEALYFAHKDWEIACDNTRTCRAAGYSSESGGISVLLTREGGPKGGLSGNLAVSIMNGTQERPITSPLTMLIDGNIIGTARYDQKSDYYQLPATALIPLVSAIKGSSTVEFTAEPSHRWSLSGAGATAVLLKMDEFQGRIGTETAFIKPGTNAASLVPPSHPVPLMSVPQVPENSERALTGDEFNAIGQWLDAQKGHNYCSWQDYPSLGIVYRLSKAQLLIEMPCNMSSYNQTYAYLLTNNQLDLKLARLVTSSATGYMQGEITSSMKARGLGDCWESESWGWNGETFKLTERSTTGMCRLITPGGTWNMPLWRSEIIKVQ